MQTDMAHLSPGDHFVMLARFTTRGVVSAHVISDAPFARVLAVRTLCTAVHTTKTRTRYTHKRRFQNDSKVRCKDSGEYCLALPHL